MVQGRLLRTGTAEDATFSFAIVLDRSGRRVCA